MLMLFAVIHIRRHDVQSYLQDNAGATAIEYGLIAAGIAVAIIVAVFAIGDELSFFFNAIQSQLAGKTARISG